MSTLRKSKQKDIFHAAMTLFSEKGFDQASMDGIAKLAGVSKRTLYKYFPNKEVLFEQIVDSLMCGFKQNQPVTFDPEQRISAQLYTVLNERMSYLLSEEYITLSRMVMVECMRHKAFAEMALNRLQEIEAGYGLYTWATQGIECGHLNISNPQLAIEQLIYAVKGTCYYPVVSMHQPLATEQQFEDSVKMACRSFELSHSA